MHGDIYYGAKKATEDHWKGFHPLDHRSTNNKFNLYAKQMLRMIGTPGAVDRVIQNDDLSTIVTGSIRLDKFKKFFPTETLHDICTTLMSHDGPSWQVILRMTDEEPGWVQFELSI